MSKLPLQGLKIVDLSRVLAGPFATQILGDLGADVIKIESPLGDDTRSWAPPAFDGDSVYYLSANRNKRSMVLDLASPRDLATLKGLIGTADVVVENFKVGSLRKWGLDYASLKDKHPSLIYCSVSAFGQSGPYAKLPGYDALIQAMAGLMSITGTDGNPTKVGVAVTDLVTGLYAVIGILAAVHERQRSRLGQGVEVSLLESQLSILSHRAMDYLATGQEPKPQGNAHGNIVPYQMFSTADGPAFVAVGNDQQFKRFCDVIGFPWDSDQRFATNPDRVRNRTLLIPEIAAAVRTWPRQTLLDKLEAAGVPAAPVNSISQVARDPQVVALGTFGRMNDGKTPCIRSPLVFSRTPVTQYRRPPGLGEHQGQEFTERSPD